MVINKVAILIDAGFFLPRYKILHGKFPIKSDIQNFTTDIIDKIQKLTGNCSTDVLFRIFYYDCRPYGMKQKDPAGKEIDFSASSYFNAKCKYLNDLRTFPQLALRLGGLSFHGWKVDLKNPGQYIPDFKQKSVDMKIGLDIAWMSSKRTIDKIVLVAGDSDFISPMKFARREGILVYLETMGQKQIKIELKEHSDFLL
ncbi:MAG: NYN domain-containing protein [Bacteroidia bacterium]|nr:NYN domain-containing protein [Bacteroidia bacterium]